MEWKIDGIWTSTFKISSSITADQLPICRKLQNDSLLLLYMHSKWHKISDCYFSLKQCQRHLWNNFSNCVVCNKCLRNVIFSPQFIRKTNRFNITGICILGIFKLQCVTATRVKHIYIYIPCSICRPYVNGEIFNMLSSVASDAPTLSPVFINLTSL